jgi:Flp pilus assembly pilin Flp
MRHGNSRCAPGVRRLLPLLRDERGGEVIEWALVAGLIAIGALAVIGAFGTKVLARWTTVNGSM